MLKKLKRHLTKDALLNSAVIILPLIIFAVMSSMVGKWIVDDAGISFAYARSLALGHGLVAQPGATPVEGFSNPTWVVVLSALHFLKLFDPVITPKVLALLFAGVTFYFCAEILRMLFSAWRIVALLSSLLLASNASYVIWANSGLENGLYGTLVVFHTYVIVRFAMKANTGIKEAALCGVLAALAGLTRPDGVLYLLVFPLTVMLVVWSRSGSTIRSYSRAIGAYLGASGLLLGGYLLFRLAYFGEIAPNTYYVKGGPSAQSALNLILLRSGEGARIADLFDGIFGVNSLLVLIPIVAIVLTHVFENRRNPAVLGVLISALVSVAIYALLPNDWMGEFRFATPFLVLVYTYIGILGAWALNRFKSNFIVKLLLLSLVLAPATAAHAAFHVKRLQTYMKRPAATFQIVAERFGFRFNEWAKMLELTGGSILVPDVGGALYYSDLKVYDLGGLCDRVIPRTMNKKQDEFYDYIFDSARPSFIAIAGTWTVQANLDADHRFRQHYTPVYEYVDEWVRKNYKKEMWSGVFVRKDDIDGKKSEFDKIQSEARRKSLKTF